jgi:hypothetical protein
VEKVKEIKQISNTDKTLIKSSQSKNKYSDFDDATFMYLRPSKNLVFWNSTSAMRRNGYVPSEIAQKLVIEYGIPIDGPQRKRRPRGKPIDALAFFEKLVIRTGVHAPSLVHDDCWGNA